MSFPVTSVLTNFTGADESPLSEGGNWSATDVTGGTARLQRVGNLCKSSFAGLGSQLWVSSFGPDMEAYLTVVALDSVGLYFRIQNGNTATYNGYAAAYDNSAHTVALYRVDAGVSTQLGGNVSVTLSAGDSFGASIVGSTLSAFRTTTGAWGAALLTRSDSTYTGVGKIGLYEGTSTAQIDDFGGGSLSTATGPGLPPGYAQQAVPFMSNSRI